MAKTKNNLAISDAEFWDQLNSHDWYSSYSDSHAVWQAGAREWKVIREIAATSESKLALLEAFKAHMNTNNDPRPPKPARPLESAAKPKRQPIHGRAPVVFDKPVRAKPVCDGAAGSVTTPTSTVEGYTISNLESDVLSLWN